MTVRNLTVATVLAAALSSCSLFNKNKDPYDTGVTHAGSNPYGVPGYDTSGAESGTYNPEGAGPVNPPANPTYSPAAYEETAPAAPSTPPAGGAAKVHTVIKGDTLWGLSRQYGVSADAIKAANNMTKDTVVLGSKLKIPAR